MVESDLLDRVEKPSATSGEDPRFIERRAAVFGERRRRYLRFVLGLLVVAAVPAVVWAVLQSPFFSVQTVDVIGIGQLAPDEVLAASGVSEGDPLIGIDPAAAAFGVQELGWVERATVTRRWPSTVEIRVSMVRLAAIVESPSGSLASMSVGGRVVLAGTESIPGVVTVTVDSELDATPGQSLGPRQSEALDAVAAMPASLKARLESVNMDEGGSLRFELSGELGILFGTGEDAALKYGQIETMLGGKIDRDGVCGINVEISARPTLRRYPDCG